MIAADPVESRRNFALTIGADYALDPTDADFAAQVAELAGVPLTCTAFDRQLGEIKAPKPYPVTVYVKKPWEDPA